MLFGALALLYPEFVNKKISTIALKTLYCVLVCPHLEYATYVLSPFYRVHIDALQLVEHKFLKQIAYKLNFLDNYTEANIFNMLNRSTITTRHNTLYKRQI